MQSFLDVKHEPTRFWRGAEDGLIGTGVMSAVMIAYASHSNTLSEPIPLAFVTRFVAAVLHLAEDRPIVMIIAIPIFLAYGAFWAGLLEGSTEWMRWWKGIALGLGIWVIMALFWPLMPFSMAAPEAPEAWLATLVMHLIYGATVGLLGQLREPHHVFSF